MPSTPSIQSTTGTIANYARKMSSLGRPEMDISLSNHWDGKTYTTFSPITGHVAITSPHEARFDSVQITLEGSIRTFVENLSPHSTKARTIATHNFLRLTMPIAETEYPVPRIAEPGRRYEFKFNFNVPEMLLPRSCSHHCSNEHVHAAHLRLPPSMGPSLWNVDDLAPEMGKVTYAVKVKVIRNRERDGEERVLCEGMKKLRIIPAVAEEPPIAVGEADWKDYVLEKTKSLKKGMFKGKLGKITVSATQPSALILTPPSESEEEQKDRAPVTTLSTLTLRFDPSSPSSQPPRLGGLTTKIKASTYYAARPAVLFPTHLHMVQQFESTRGVYDMSVPLSSRCVEAVGWEKHVASPKYTRRGSNSSTSTSCSSNSSSDENGKNDGKGRDGEEGRVYYTAQIPLPISLPSSKSWLPTFHSCILSRTYTLEHSLSIHTPGTGVPATTISLRVPVQVAAKGREGGRRLSVEEIAEEEREAERFWEPRTLEIPAEEMLGHSRLAAGGAARELPPSYEDFGRMSTVRSRG